MSLVGVGRGSHVFPGEARLGGPMSDVGGVRAGRGTCTVRSNASWVMGTPAQSDGQTRLKPLPSRNFVGGRQNTFKLLNSELEL